MMYGKWILPWILYKICKCLVVTHEVAWRSTSTPPPQSAPPCTEIDGPKWVVQPYNALRFLPQPPVQFWAIQVPGKGVQNGGTLQRTQNQRFETSGWHHGWLYNSFHRVLRVFIDVYCVLQVGLGLLMKFPSTIHASSWVRWVKRSKVSSGWRITQPGFLGSWFTHW